MLILAIVVIGLAAGWVAQIILHERKNPAEAFVVGLIGSLVGGTLSSLIAGDGFNIRITGLLGSIVGAVIVLAIWRAVRLR
jgi:uncharacterized membrane protein YeaQ/YmgE (transglycosylase-associated protein family)